jgi:hypothetical protein
MTALLDEYGQRLRHRHGWEVQLLCPICGYRGLPDYGGWTASAALNFADQPTIFANVTCQKCGQDLKQEAGEKLVEMFTGVPTPTLNRQLLLTFIGLMVGVPMITFAAIWAGIQLGWWGNVAYTVLAGLSLLLLPAMFWFNWQIHGIRHRCECGNPDYLFMGMLGRSSCYRCSSCGRLLRLRD